MSIQHKDFDEHRPRDRSREISPNRGLDQVKDWGTYAREQLALLIDRVQNSESIGG